jgi:hypothetical protein
VDWWYVCIIGTGNASIWIGTEELVSTCYIPRGRDTRKFHFWILELWNKVFASTIFVSRMNETSMTCGECLRRCDAIGSPMMMRCLLVQILELKGTSLWFLLSLMGWTVRKCRCAGVEDFGEDT